MKTNSSNTSLNTISIPSAHPVGQKSRWESLPWVLWTEVIFTFVDIKILLELVKVSHQFHDIANDKKTVFNLFTRTFYYLREFFSETPADLKNPLREMGSQLVNGLETYDKNNYWYKANRTTLNNNIDSMGIRYGMSCLKIPPDLHRKFTRHLEIGDIDAAIRILVKTSFDRGTLAEDLSSLRSHGGQTVLGELKKSFKWIPISKITKNCQKNPYLNEVFDHHILDYSKQLIDKNLLDVSFFQLDNKNRAAGVLEKIIQSKEILDKQIAHKKITLEEIAREQVNHFHKAQKQIDQFYILSYACSQFDFFLKIHADFKEMPRDEYSPANYPINIVAILSYCVIYKQSELMQELLEQILPLRPLHLSILISLSIEYSDPMAMHLLLKKCKDMETLNRSIDKILAGIKDPVCLCSFIKLRKQEFLNSAFKTELRKKIIIIELLSVTGYALVEWFLVNWRDHVLKNAQEGLPATEREFEELTAHFGRQSITHYFPNQDNLILLILKYSPCPYKHAQQILESRQLFRPLVLEEASILINKKIETSDLVSVGLLAGHNRKHNLTENKDTPAPKRRI
jgi:hypothetical protein